MNKTHPMPVPQAKQRPLTEEDKKVKIMQFLQQKREQFAINILCNLVQGAITNKDATNMDCKLLVGVAVEMADGLLEKLYPLPEEKKEEETPAEKESK